MRNEITCTAIANCSQSIQNAASKLSLEHDVPLEHLNYMGPWEFERINRKLWMFKVECSGHPKHNELICCEEE